MLCFIVTFPCGVLGLVWFLIVSIPDLCLLTDFAIQVLRFRVCQLIVQLLLIISTKKMCKLKCL